MATIPVCVDYNHELKPLEDLLSGVERPGDFFVSGNLEAPMPKVEVEGVGVLSFPVPAAQIKEIIRQAVRAPYGRGEETILDTSVRNVWQLTPAKVRLGGKSWEHSFQHILSAVAGGLGCAGVNVSAELYKLLVYDEGSFFKEHRDTEKSDGMFGTLVIVLPSAHRGGELVIRHAGRETTVNLSGGEVSELAFAAFYADCEHEVRPITQGSRVCLVYNLIQRQSRKKDKPLTAPLYDAEVAAAATLLDEALTSPSAPLKIAWLLEHHYSPAGLSFSGLKNADAARAKVLAQAALRAGCAAHLAIVHIEEYGSAELNYDPDYDRRSRWRQYDDDNDEGEDEQEDAGSEDFDVIEVDDATHFVDEWVDLEDRRVEFGPIPLEPGELVPDEALDGEEPDEQRVMEATGNEGASFERSYHRAALVVWHRNRYAEVLLRAGVGAAIPYLTERVHACGTAPVSAESKRETVALANLILDHWETTPLSLHGRDPKKPSRAEMLELLYRLGEVPFVERFIGGIVTKEYDGSENVALIAVAPLVGDAKAGDLFSGFVRANMRRVHGGCIEFLTGLVKLLKDPVVKPTAKWDAAVRQVAAAVVAGLAEVGKPWRSPRAAYWPEDEVEKTEPEKHVTVADLFDALGELTAAELRRKTVDTIASSPAAFDPVSVVVPALSLLSQRHGERVNADAGFLHLWQHAAEFLLARSEHPPEPPRDWRQAVTLSCRCEDCRELQSFACNPAEHAHRFRVRKDRRQHLHETIKQHDLDMTHVTERKGSPQTLVCTKTRGAYQRRCAQYRADLAAMTVLFPLLRAGGERANLVPKLVAAVGRSARTTNG